MNDPHVVALVYRIEHGDDLSYEDAKPRCFKKEEFNIFIDNNGVRFEFNKHYSTTEEAEKSLEEYIRIWNFDAQLCREPDSFRLDFVQSEITDRRPNSGEERWIEATTPSDSVTDTLTRSFGEYPAPPSGIALNPDVKTMHYRYMQYKRDREPLPSMAYFCLTMLEDPPEVSKEKSRKSPIRDEKRKEAAKKYFI